MKNSTRRHAQRMLLGAFLTSGLSTDELQKLSMQLSSDPAFLREFSMLLQDVLHFLVPGPMMMKEQFDSPSHPLEPSSLAYKTITRRRLSKVKVLSIMRMADPNIGNLDTNLPMRAVVAEFFSRVSPANAERFLTLIGATADDDPYLSGIFRKI